MPFKSLSAMAMAVAVLSHGVAPAATLYASDAFNRLHRFDSATPGTIDATVLLSGLQSGETLQGLDFRPANGRLYAIGSSKRFYTVDVRTGVATPVSSTVIATGLPADGLGFDFNPAADRIRVVSKNRDNIRVNPDTGALAGTDTALAYGPGDPGVGTNPVVTAEAYSNDNLGATSTTLYAIDTARDVLATQGSVNGNPISPNAGRLSTVGALGVNATAAAGFDIVPRTGDAFAVLTVGSSTSLYSIDLANGAATLVGPVGSGALPLRSLAAAPPPTLGERIYGVTVDNRLLAFRSNTPGTVDSELTLSGLANGEQIVGIDFRPATGQLYGLSSASRIYRINTTDGYVTQVGAGPTSPLVTAAETGFDFNPTADRIRVVGQDRQNLRINPDNGTVAGVDSQLTYAVGDPNAGQTPNIRGSAYTNSTAGAVATTLYGIDARLGTLVRQGSVNGTPTSPNVGSLTTIGQLGIATSGTISFDISPASGIAYASFGQAQGGIFGIVDLETGATFAEGTIGGGAELLAMAVEPPVGERLVGLGAANELLFFRSESPGLVERTTALAIPTGVTLRAIDYRPANGSLYALGSDSRIYRVLDLRKGTVTQVPLSTPLIGTSFGFDFNPVADRARIVSNTGQNFRVDVDTGTVTVDTALDYRTGDPNGSATPAAAGAAYSNSNSGATSTALYVIDPNLDVLALQEPPNAGTLNTVGTLGLNVAQVAGFDISAATGAAYAVFNNGSGGASALYSIDLADGRATPRGSIGLATTATLRGLAVVPEGFRDLDPDTYSTGSVGPSPGSPYIQLGQNVPGFAFPTYDAASGAYRANIVADTGTAPPRVRVTGVFANTAEQLPYSQVGPNRWVRAKYSIYAGGQSDASAANTIPNLRVRASVRFALTSILEVYNHINADPAGSGVAAELRPSQDPTKPSIYRVDIDPVDVPYLVANPNTEGVRRGFEAYSTDAQDNGYLALTESSIGPYEELLSGAGAPVKVYASDKTTSSVGNLGQNNPNELFRAVLIPPATPGGVYASDPSIALPTQDQDLNGVTLDTRGVPANRIGLALREFYPGSDVTAADYVRVEEGRQYIVRFHLLARGDVPYQAHVRARARTAKFNWVQRYELGGVWAIGQDATNPNAAIALQAVPGNPCVNPDQQVAGEQGGYYNLLMATPLSPDIRPEVASSLGDRMPLLSAQPGPRQPAPSLRDLKLGLDLIDTISAAANNFLEGGRITVDRMEVYSVPLVAD